MEFADRDEMMMEEDTDEVEMDVGDVEEVSTRPSFPALSAADALVSVQKTLCFHFVILLFLCREDEWSTEKYGARLTDLRPFVISGTISCRQSLSS